MSYAEVILPLPFPAPFTYRIPDTMDGRIHVGSRVGIPFGKQKYQTGIVLQLLPAPPEGLDPKAIKDIARLPEEDHPIVLPAQLRLWQWMSSYYLCAPGEAMKAALPAGLKPEHSDLNQLFATPRSRVRKPAPAEAGIPPYSLTIPQQEAYESLQRQWTEKDICLLHGVTSSGKTELYIHLIRDTLAQGKQVLYLLPEIALTTQITNRLRTHFGDQLGVFHSGYTDKVRTDLWRKQLSAQPYPLILGARSAVLLPFQQLGLIIVDEEHESSYKQFDPAPRYHARSVALMLAADSGGDGRQPAKVLLGSATPSIESYAMARTGRYGFAELKTRYADVQMPHILPVDIRELRRKKLMTGSLSPHLLQAIHTALQQGEQVILFQNRRGFAPLLECKHCGQVPHCPNCDVSLTYHKAGRHLICHYCGHSEAVPTLCPACEEPSMQPLGTGTERVEEEIAQHFPTARIGRLDADAAHSRRQYEQLLDSFAAGELDILIGTQMVSKGLDFRNVRLVGIIDADSMLNFPDFRAHERAFQLMVQVAGRAGRTAAQGQVILQTRSMEHPLIDQIVRADYAALYNTQMQERTLFRYPPHYRLIYLYVKHRDAAICRDAAQCITTVLTQYLGTRVSSPIEPPVSRIGRLYIRQTVIKVEASLAPAKVREILHYAQEVMHGQVSFRAATVYYDVDPM